MRQPELLSKLGVLWALLGQPPVSGYELCATITASGGRRCTPGRLLPILVVLEERGLLSVDRAQEPYRYALTAAGTEAARTAGPGRPEPLVLVMADLVGFTRFTAQHGDRAAHEQASRLVQLARRGVEPLGGSLVKSLGDGVLLALPERVDPEPLLRALAGSLADSEPGWLLHAGAHAGTPIRYQGDVFGRDVNLVARLCDAARPGELLVTCEQDGEPLRLEGLDDPVRVRRVTL